MKKSVFMPLYVFLFQKQTHGEKLTKNKNFRKVEIQ